MSYNELINFSVCIVLSFLLGLEIKTYKENMKNKYPYIGSTRTYTFLGMIGFILFKINIWVYISGFAGFTALYAIYYKNISKTNPSIILYLLAVIVYSLGPLSQTHSIWMPGLVFVSVIFILNSKKSLKTFTQKIDTKEIETLSKFLLLSIVILPLLPKNNISFLGISPFKIWLAVVVISAISYSSYLLSKFVFKEKGFLISGIFGGLYSSTATTVVLAKKASSDISKIINASIIIATSMMYLRLIVITYIFNKEIAGKIFWWYIAFATAAIAVSLFYYKKENKSVQNINDQNPLELQTAFIFAGLFVIMMLITKTVTSNFGESGLKILSFITGFTDIDPFVLSLLMGKFHITQQDIVNAIFIATGSNNLLKALYAYIFGKKYTLISVIWLSVFSAATIMLGVL